MENWESIMKTDNTLQVEIARGMLEENGIPAVVLDRKDSSYTNIFGYVELMVPRQDVEAAQALLNNESKSE